MHALLVYGSLMHPKELARHRLSENAAVPVRVRGYRRSFCQEPSWRVGSAGERGVLTVHPSEDAWFNGVMVCGLDTAVFESLDERERGYGRIHVPASRLALYPGAEDPPRCRNLYLYTGRSEKYNASLLPNSAYLALCTEAASRWGTDFLDDFLSTTFIQGRTPLRSYDRSPGGR